MAHFIRTLRAHWTHYAAEGGSLAIFMLIAAFAAATLTIAPEPFRSMNPILHRFAFGLVMGLTLVALIYSPLGSHAGGHLNPAMTIAYFWLRKIEPLDAAFYVAAQFIGAAGGLMLAALFLHGALAHPSVHFIVTRPGMAGEAVAFVAEFAIAFVLMLAVLALSNSERYSRFTGVFAATLVLLYITLEAPLSGPSMNPARSFASALAAGDFGAIWIYFTAPPLAMLAAGFAFVRLRGFDAVRCAKLYHRRDDPACIFRCGYRR